MKVMLAFLLVLLLLSPVALAAYSNYADDADIADDVTGFVKGKYGENTDATLCAKRLDMNNSYY